MTASAAYERAVARSSGKPLGGADMTVEPQPDFTGHNGGPPLDPIVDPTEAFKKIDDLYEEAKNFADGEPITSAEMAEAITALFEGLHAAGKEAEELRVAAKKPLDDAVDKVQALYNPYVQPKRGKVALGKDALGALLTAWRVEQARIAAVAAQKAREEAAALQAEAEAAMRASAGNLAERERAEEVVGFAKQASKFANKAEKAATTGLGLRTVWSAELVDEEAALEWAYGRDPGRFRELVQKMADEAIGPTMRTIPGFKVIEGKRAA